MRLKAGLVLGGVLALLAASEPGGAPAATAPAATPTPTPTPALGLPFVEVSPVRTPEPEPEPEPAATPPPDQFPARLALGRVRHAGGKLRMALSARGGTVTAVRVELRRAERTLRAVDIASLTGTRKLALKPRGALSSGVYVVRVTVDDVIAADREVTVTR